MNKPTCMVLLLALACVRSGQTQNQNSAATGALSGLALKHTQAPDIHITPEAYRTQVVQEILRAGLPVRGSIQLQRMGDEAAVSLMKIFGGSLTLLTDTEKLTAVAILETAYGNPDTILNASDREMSASSFLLRYLDSSTQDVALKEKIATARERISMAIAHFKAPPPPK